ncbi:hypothetical protein [Rhodococcus sp. (in: high G+C Gram-positive bacteria)]|uniref:hypothetical protein n=1 Tax=Rhodococcus sp. TaxID=1831 RepID=UPI003BB626CD
MIAPEGEIVDFRAIDSAEDAYVWFVDRRADNTELGRGTEAQYEGGTGHFVDGTDCTRRR